MWKEIPIISIILHHLCQWVRISLTKIFNKRPKGPSYRLFDHPGDGGNHACLRRVEFTSVTRNKFYTQMTENCSGERWCELIWIFSFIQAKCFNNNLAHKPESGIAARKFHLWHSKSAELALGSRVKCVEQLILLGLNRVKSDHFNSVCVTV